MPITPSLRHSSNKYKLAREGEKEEEKDEDFEKVKVLFYFILLFSSNQLSVDLKKLFVKKIKKIIHSSIKKNVSLIFYL